MLQENNKSVVWEAYTALGMVLNVCLSKKITIKNYVTSGEPFLALFITYINSSSSLHTKLVFVFCFWSNHKNSPKPLKANETYIMQEYSFLRALFPACRKRMDKDWGSKRIPLRSFL